MNRFLPSSSGWGTVGALAITLLFAAAFSAAAQATPGLQVTRVDVKDGAVTVTTDVAGFDVVDRQGQASVPGQGHVHFFLDIQAPTTPGQPAVPPGGGGAWAHVSGTSYTFPDVAPGPHTVAVELVNNDHTPLNPAVVVQQDFTVR